MKTEKKLKRGLTELSHLFLPPGKNGNGKTPKTFMFGPYFAPPETKIRKFTIAPPADSGIPERPKHLIGAAVLPVGTAFQTENQIHLLETLNGTFDTSYFLSPAGAETDSGVRSHSQKEHIVLGFLSDSELQEVLEPKLAGHFDPSDPSKPSLVLFDPLFLNSVGHSIFSFLDHCVFAIPVDYEQFVHAYQLMQYCLTQNPNLRYSLLIVGQGAKTNWDFVYERFCDIVSHFLGCDLGFLGWMEDGEVRLNGDLLLEESGGAVQAFAKRRLSELLSAYALQR